MLWVPASPQSLSPLVKIPLLFTGAFLAQRACPDAIAKDDALLDQWIADGAPAAARPVIAPGSVRAGAGAGPREAWWRPQACASGP